jgi:glutamate--cysteine ligase
VSTDVEGGAVIESRRQLIEHLASGEKARPAWRIGTEHEKFVFRRSDLAPLAYEGANGIGEILRRMVRFGWEPIHEDGALIGLKRAGASISLEPGGQFELSGAPLISVHETCAEVNGHLSEVRAIGAELGVGFLGLGFHPTAKLDAIPIMPKGRYRIMRAYMPKVGTLGRDMMFRTCTVQTNLDFASEADMVKKLRVSLALQPIATALFANSPLTEGRPNGFLSYRSQIWTDTDNARAGMLPFAFDDGFGYERYADYALDVPMYFLKRQGQFIDATGGSFRDFLAGKLAQAPGERPTMQDWVSHLSTIFPEVRLKTYLEMRGADAGPWSRLCSLPAFWVGLLYDQTALDAAWDMVRDWTAEERQALRDGAPRMALKTPFRGRTIRELAIEALKIARAGLGARGRSLPHGVDETSFLDELDGIAESGVTPAERILERLSGEWGGDVGKLYEACAY